MWKCPKCETVNQNSTHCVICGEAKPQNKMQQHSTLPLSHIRPFDNRTVKTEQVVKTKNNTWLIIIIVLIAILIAMLALVAGILLGSKQSDSAASDHTATVTVNSDSSEKPLLTAEPEQTTLPDAAPSKTTAPQTTVPAKKIPNNIPSVKSGYGLYTNANYEFFCAYPTTYTETSPYLPNMLKCFKSRDGLTEMTISVVPGFGNLSGKQALNSLIASSSGNVDYRASKNNWYAVSIAEGSTKYYRKAFVYDNNLIYFDFFTEYGEPDSTAIEYIEDHFKIYTY